MPALIMKFSCQVEMKAMKTHYQDIALVEI